MSLDDEKIHLKMDKAWKCVLSQFGELIKNSYQTYGEGMAIFTLRDKVTNVSYPPQNQPTKSNADFYYSLAVSSLYSSIIQSLPSTEDLKIRYQPLRHVLVCMNIEVEGEVVPVSEVRIFDVETLAEIPYFKGLP